MTVTVTKPPIINSQYSLASSQHFVLKKTENPFGLIYTVFLGFLLDEVSPIT
jgi:hypothetical protein